MPLRWHIDHPRCRVTATPLKTTSEQEMYDFLGDVIAQGAMPYAKLFDASAAVRWIKPNRIGPIAATAQLYGRMGLGPVGPLAIVVADNAATRRAEEYAKIADAVRLARVFEREDDAEAWLQALPQAAAKGRALEPPEGHGKPPPKLVESRRSDRQPRAAYVRSMTVEGAGMTGDQGQIKAKREAAERARRLVSQFTLEEDRARVLRFAADLDAQADELERATNALPPAPQVTQVQMQMQQGPPAKNDPDKDEG